MSFKSNGAAPPVRLSAFLTFLRSARDKGVMQGTRVTDAVAYFQRRGELRGTVKMVRERDPDRLRWRNAVFMVTQSAAPLAGLERARVEEPVREVVLDLSDFDLQREVVIDARRTGIDLDRGEVLPQWNVADLRRMAFLTGTDIAQINSVVPVSNDFFAPIDTAGCVLVGRILATRHKHRAKQILTGVPAGVSPRPLEAHERQMLERAQRESERSRRWAALANALLERTK